MLHSSHFLRRFMTRTFLLLPLCGVSIVGNFGSSSAIFAAPATLRFDATIGTIFPGIPFDSGIDFALGDIVSGHFTFEPAEGDGGVLMFATMQPYEFSLDIGGAKFSTHGFEIQSLNDTVITDFAPASSVDSLQVGAGGLSAADPTMFPNIDPTTSGLTLLLFGPTSSVSIPRYPEDPAVWNNFNLFRALTVAFGDGMGGVVGFQATVGQFATVPEPSAISISTLLVVIALFTHRYRVSRVD